MPVRSALRRRLRAAAATLTSAALVVTGLALGAPANADSSTSVEDAVFRWGVNAETHAAAFAPGTYNLVSAGVVDMAAVSDRVTADNWKQSEGSVSIHKTGADGALAPATFAGLRTNAEGTVNTVGNGGNAGSVVEIGAGSGTVDVAAGTADIRWNGTFTVAYYSGMTRFWVKDPRLVVAGNGAGTVTATLGGWGTSMDDPDKFEVLTPVADVTIASLSGVEVTPSGFTVTPDYRGVTTTSAGQDRTGADWGSFPQGFVDFQQRTGQGSYWYSSGLSADKRKPASPLSVNYTVATIAAPTISAQPTASTVRNGEAASFTVVATGGDVTYQWQRSADGAEWVDIDGATSATYSATVATADDGARFRAVVTGRGGSVTSDAATLTVRADTAVRGVQLEWAYSGYAQSGVFGPWRQWATGDRVTVTSFGKDRITGVAADAETRVTGVRFDGGAGTFDPVTGEGSISWGGDGKWLINAYPSGIGAPDETLSNPVLTVASDGTGTLSFDATIPAHNDYMNGNAPVAAVGPARVVVATFSSVSIGAGGVVRVVPDFAGRAYTPPSTIAGWEACGGAGGSWPAEWIDFVPDSVKAHYYSTACAGLNATKPPFPFAVYTQPSPVAVTTQPVDTTLSAGADTTISVAVEGNPSPVITWERKDEGTWTNVPDVRGTSWRISDAAPALTGTYRAAFTTEVATVYSDEFALTVTAEAPTAPTPQFGSPEYGPGETVRFTSFVTGHPEPAIVWQRSADDGRTWTTIDGANEVAYALTATLADDGARFRVIADNGVGPAAVSEASAPLHVAANATVLTRQPVSQLAPTRPLSGSATATFSVAAALERPIDGYTPTFSYRWQRWNGGSWTDIAGSRDSLSLSTADLAEDGTRVRVAVTRGDSTVVSDEATLRVVDGKAPRIRALSSQTIEPGQAVLAAAIESDASPAPVLQWQRSLDGVTWTDVSGATSATLAFEATSEDSGNRYRLTADNGVPTRAVAAGMGATAVVSSVATLTVVRTGPPVVTVQPTDTGMSVFAGAARQTATTSVTAVGLPVPAYQWQSSADGGQTWTSVTGATSPTLSVTGPSAAQDGTLYRARVSNTEGETFSDPVRLRAVTASGRALLIGQAPIAPGAAMTLPVAGTGFTTDTGTWTTGVRLAVFAASDVTPGQLPDITRAVSPVTTVGASLLRVGEGAFSARTVTIAAGALDPQVAYVLAAFSSDDAVREYDAVTPLIVQGQTAPEITTHPSDVVAGPSAELSVAATGTPAPTYQWQLRTGEKWTDVAGASSATLSVAGAGQSGEYRVVASNALGTATSRTATVTARQEPVVLSDAAVFEWAVNGSSQGASASGACGYFVAGVGDGTEASYKTVDQDLTIIKRSLSGDPIRVTAENRCAPVDGTDGAQRLRYENGHATKDADGVVTVTWKGAFTVYAYGGLVPWSVEHPTLTIRPDGTGTVTADLRGYASSMENPDVKVPLEPVAGQTVLDLKDVSIDGDVIRATPVYEGVDYFPLTPDGTRSTVSAISAEVKAANPAWGSWPQDFVDFQYRTGLASYWHTSGGGADPQKAPRPLVLSLAGEQLDYVDFAGLTITAQPVKVQAVTGGTASFSVAATSGKPLSYQWQVQLKFGAAWTDVPGASDRELVLTNLERTTSSLPKYRVEVSDGVQRITSGTATLEVKDPAAPKLTLQPTAQTGFAGATVRFQVRAAGYPAVSQQWQISRDGGSSWEDYGTPTDTLTITDLPVSLDGALFRAIGNNGIGEATMSAAAGMRVLTAAQPTLAVHPGEPDRFAYPVDPTVRGRAYVVAGGLPATGLPEWVRVGVVDAATWTARGEGFSASDLLAVTGVQTASNLVNGTFGPVFVELPAGLLDASKDYVAVLVSDTAGDRSLDAAAPVVLAGQSAPTASVQASASTIDAGRDLVVTATVTGTPTPTLQWQRQVSGGEWADIAGATAATLSETGATVSASYRVVAVNGLGRVESAPVAVTVVPLTPTEAPVITAQPVSVLAPAVPVSGDPVASFAVAVTGTPAPTVVWQKRVGDDWIGVGEGERLSFPYTPADAGTQFRAVASSTAGSATSLTATLTLGDPASVSNPMSTATVVQGADLRLTASVAGTSTVVRWQRLLAADEWTDVAGADTPTHLVPAAEVRHGVQYRAVVHGPVPFEVGGAASSAVSEPTTLVLTAPSAAPAAATSAQLDAAPSLPIVSADGRTYTLEVGADRAGRYVSTWLHSTPVDLGWRLVDAAGRATVTIPAGVAAGAHRIAVLDDGGRVVGTAGITVAADGIVSAAVPPVATALPVTGGGIAVGLVAFGMIALLGGAATVAGVRRARSGRSVE